MTSLPPRGPQGHITLEVLEERMYQQHEAIMSAVDGVNKRMDRLNGSVQECNERIETNRLMAVNHIQEPGHATEIQRQLSQELLLKEHSEKFTALEQSKKIKDAVQEAKNGAFNRLDKWAVRVQGLILFSFAAYEGVTKLLS